jgi:hypothetical protein
MVAGYWGVEAGRLLHCCWVVGEVLKGKADAERAAVFAAATYVAAEQVQAGPCTRESSQLRWK